MPKLKCTIDGEWYVTRRGSEPEVADGEAAGLGFYTYQLDQVAESCLIGELGLEEGDSIENSVFWKLRENYHLYTRVEMQPRTDLHNLLFEGLKWDNPDYYGIPRLDRLNQYLKGGEFTAFSRFDELFWWPGRSQDDRGTVRTVYISLAAAALDEGLISVDHFLKIIKR